MREVPGLDVLDERLAGAPGVFAYDPLRLGDRRARHARSGYELARLLREQDDVHLELAGENVIVAVFGMGEDAGPAGERLVAALRRAVEPPERGERDRAEEAFAPPPPWGELVMTPREAFLGAAGGRAGRATRSAAWRPSRSRPTRRDPERAARASG